MKVMLILEQTHILTLTIHTYYLMVLYQQPQLMMLPKTLLLTLHSMVVEPTIVFG